MEQHESIKLFLDRDPSGQKVTQYALSLNNKYKDESSLYKNDKDLNDMLVKFGKTEKKNLRQKL
jgi:hypothetical protein